MSKKIIYVFIVIIILIIFLAWFFNIFNFKNNENIPKKEVKKVLTEKEESNILDSLSVEETHTVEELERKNKNLKKIENSTEKKNDNLVNKNILKKEDVENLKILNSLSL